MPSHIPTVEPRPLAMRQNLHVSTFVDTGDSLLRITNVDTWSRTMRVQVKQWGNSASIRIPASVMAAASLHIDQSVEVREAGGRVLIEPLVTPTYHLADLLASSEENTSDLQSL